VERLHQAVQRWTEDVRPTGRCRFMSSKNGGFFRKLGVEDGLTSKWNKKDQKSVFTVNEWCLNQ
jgi:hypothetical protein